MKATSPILERSENKGAEIQSVFLVKLSTKKEV